MNPASDASAAVSAVSAVSAIEAPMRVWLRPVGANCKVRVDEADGARRLREMLPNEFQGVVAFDLNKSPGAILLVPLNTRSRLARLENALQSHPGVELMLEPA